MSRAQNALLLNRGELESVYVISGSMRSFELFRLYAGRTVRLISHEVFNLPTCMYSCKMPGDGIVWSKAADAMIIYAMHEMGERPID